MVGIMGDSPRTPEGGQAGKRWWEGWEWWEWWEWWEIMGAMGAVGGVKRKKLCQSFRALIKFINLFKLNFNDISTSLTPNSGHHILILHSLLYCFL